MSNFVTAILIALISAGTGGVITGLFHRSLVQAKVKSIISDTYDQLIKTLNDQVATLQDDVARLRERLDHLMRKEIEYLSTITEMTKKHNLLQIEISKKESIIQRLQSAKPRRKSNPPRS